MEPLTGPCVPQEPGPTLHDGDIVIMDNLSAHKVNGIRESIAAAGARVFYLSPYSPDPNPIETVFFKVQMDRLELQGTHG